MSKAADLSIQQQQSIWNLQQDPTEDTLWQAVVAFQNFPLYTASGLPYQYQIKTGKRGALTRELLIDRRQNSKTLAWSSVCLAFHNAMEKQASENEEEQMIRRPKALGDIRGISYIYPLLWRFGMIKVPEKAEVNMSGEAYQYTLFE